MNLPIIDKQNINFNGEVRNWIVAAPPNPASIPMPVVFMLHGDAGTAVHASQNYGWIEKGMKENFLVVFPEGALLKPGKPSNFVANPTSWSHDANHNDINEFKNNTEFLSLILKNLESKYVIDPSRIYFTGFSSGGILSFYLATALHDKIAAIAPVCGYMPSLVYNLVNKPMSIMFIVGEADTINPLHGGVGKKTPWISKEMIKRPMLDSLEPWLHTMNLTKDSYKLLKDNDVRIQQYSSSPREEIYFIIVKRQGHEWPGGKQVLPEDLSGKNLQTLNATDAIWEFFKTKRLNSATEGS